ncbi:MAG: hypothetical protein ACPG5Z_15565 [Pseudoalteromonas sp.]
MSTLISITIKPKENILQSIVEDFITFSMLAFCIYISQNSTFWTFITGLMFLFMLWVKLALVLKENVTTFKGFNSAIDFLKDKQKSD